MSAASKLLERLEGVRSTGPGKWQALCPAHADRDPSLSIDETDTGDLLVHLSRRMSRRQTSSRGSA